MAEDGQVYNLSGVTLTGVPSTTTTTTDSPSITLQITPPCELLGRQFTPLPFRYEPPHTEGDGDFKGHGPDVTATVTLAFQHDTAWVTVYMKARETQSDFTTVEGTSDIYVIYEAPRGWLIHEFFAQSAETIEYRDNDHDVDIFPGETLVKNWLFQGDGPSADVGRTSVVIDFHELNVRLVEDADCIAPPPLRP